MNKIYLLVVAVVLASTTMFSQEIAAADTTPNWTKGGSVSLNFTNTGLVNWSAGGQNSIALGAIIDLYANYKEGKNTWVNSINWAAGAARVGDETELIKKSDDQLIIFSKYRKNVKENWGFAAFAELRTQVLNNPIYELNPADTVVGSDTKREIKTDNYTSGFLSPGYLVTSIGWEYNKGDNFYVHATPLAGKGTFVLDDSLSALGLYGVDPGKKSLFQLGALTRVGWKADVMDNVNFSTNLMLFSPYEKFGNIDVTWETLTTFKINKYLTTTFATQLLYFDNSKPKIVESVDANGDVIETAKHGIQFKHVLNIGLLAKF